MSQEDEQSSSSLSLHAALTPSTGVSQVNEPAGRGSRTTSQDSSENGSVTSLTSPVSARSERQYRRVHRKHERGASKESDKMDNGMREQGQAKRRESD